MTAPHRTDLHCPHFGRCGGCTLLDVGIDEQLLRKQTRARELLAPWLLGIEPAIAPPPRTPRHDRTAILFPAQRRDRELRLGIFRPGTHEIEPIEDCRIQHKGLTRLAVRAGEVLRALRLPAYDEIAHRGLVRAFRARVMASTGELLFGLVVTDDAIRDAERLAERMWRAATDLRDDQGQPLEPIGFVLNKNPHRGNVLLGPDTVVQRGRGWQRDEVAGLQLRVSFASFYQQNRHADAILFRPALAMLGPVTGLRVVDGYGGIGAFGLRLLRAGAAEVTIIESSPSACADARHNLHDNAFRNGSVREEAFGQTPLPPCDLLIADPPRAGLMAQGAAAILAAAPARVLLVSCALESLARDLGQLAPAYRVTELRLCDLFPHTEHVEALTMLERR
ncbi:MAG: class I SAM-dependent RNA methyltransferase [Planctomycetes bacterium]|nr:class I SAM-dependent RNA methyltransferase [Planctomycetota bacterium]